MTQEATSKYPAVIDIMTRDELIIASFFATPHNQRFNWPNDPQAGSAADECGKMVIGMGLLKHMSDESLRAYVNFMSTAPHIRTSEMKTAFEAALADANKTAIEVAHEAVVQE